MIYAQGLQELFSVCMCVCQKFLPLTVLNINCTAQEKSNEKNSSARKVQKRHKPEVSTYYTKLMKRLCIYLHASTQYKCVHLRFIKFNFGFLFSGKILQIVAHSGVVTDKNEPVSQQVFHLSSWCARVFSFGSCCARVFSLCS